MKYQVGEYDLVYNAHRCTDETGHRFYIDLMVSADLNPSNEEYDQYMKDLTGKTVEIELLTHYVAIGHGVKVVS